MVQPVDDGGIGWSSAPRRSSRAAASADLWTSTFGSAVDWTVRLAVTATAVRHPAGSALDRMGQTNGPLGEMSVGPLKSAVDRPRRAPHDQDVKASYPSGNMPSLQPRKSRLVTSCSRRMYAPAACLGSHRPASRRHRAEPNIPQREIGCPSRRLGI